MYLNANTFLAKAPTVIVSCPPFTSPHDVIDDRIDVFAQYALLRMFKSDPAAKADAQGMLCAVKTGQLAGIYKEDERVPALRARKINRGWWQIIPPDEDATLMSDPVDPVTGSPIIVFRDSVRSKPFRLDPGLRKAYRVFQTFQTLRQRTCPQLEDLALGVPSMGAEELLPEPDDSCRLIECVATQKLNKAVCDFKQRLKNPWLVCWGQNYWDLLAKRALENAKEKEGKCSRDKRVLRSKGTTLQRALRRSYLNERRFSEPWPKSPRDLWDWFLEKQKKKLTWCDQQALQASARNQCCNTVQFVMQVLAQQTEFARGTNSLGTVNPDNFIDRFVLKKKECFTFGSSRLKEVVQKLKATLDEGYFVQAGVYPPNKPCERALILPSLGHYVLIIGYDANQFIYWNTVGDRQDDPNGKRFGLLEYDGQRLATPSMNYQVVYLNSLASACS